MVNEINILKLEIKKLNEKISKLEKIKEECLEYRCNVQTYHCIKCNVKCYYTGPSCEHHDDLECHDCRALIFCDSCHNHRDGMCYDCNYGYLCNDCSPQSEICMSCERYKCYICDKLFVANSKKYHQIMNKYGEIHEDNYCFSKSSLYNSGKLICCEECIDKIVNEKTIISEDSHVCRCVSCEELFITSGLNSKNKILNKYDNTCIFCNATLYCDKCIKTVSVCDECMKNDTYCNDCNIEETCKICKHD